MRDTAIPQQLKTILIASSLVLSMVMGVRHGFGFWMQPISLAHHWPREVYASALACQNLMWGMFGPLAGIFADRLGVARIVVIGGFCFVAGLLCMAYVDDPTLFIISTGCLIGAGLSCTTFSIMSGIIGRSAPGTLRPWAFGIASAMGSFGQFLMMPVEQQLISHSGWQHAYLILAIGLVLAVPCAAYFLREPHRVADAGPQQSILEAIREAFNHRPFLYLLAGYFVCGFQAVFIGVHLPSYLKDKNILDPNVAVTSLALIGLFNIIGSYAAGKLGCYIQKHYILSTIYTARLFLFSAFLFFPLTPMSVYLFSAIMGLLWLSSVPLTNGIIADIFGVKYLSMLSGFIFFSHQLGSFFGAWLGGYLYTRYGNYNVMWFVILVVGVFATLINLPINETPIQRQRIAFA
jgi:MFS family permease